MIEGLRSASLREAPQRRGDILEFLRNTCVDLFRWRCPVSSPTAAEVWLELQSYGIPVLVVGALLALCVPLLLFFANSSQSGIPLVLAVLTLIGPFMAGVSASIWNRRNSWRAQVGAFEAARPIGTAKLIGLQILVTSLCIFGGWLLISASFRLSLPLLGEGQGHGLRALAVQLQNSGLRLVSAVTVGFVMLASVLALLAAMRAFASWYGWRLWFGLFGLAVYSVGLTIAVARDWIGGAAIGVHLWAVAIAIPIGTIFVFGRALARGILTPRQVGVASLAWLLFAVLFLDLLRTSGAMAAPPALEALAFASMLLPLTAAGLAPWSLSLVRHA